ncbi:MAG: TetR family transcriptional regulator [Anaerolineae bacterium]|nr:TetR family transcriptional regulator [Anaerolineae bacterium]
MSAIPPPQEKLDPRVKRTRALIQQAFNELLAEKGFNAISVQDITRQAEINRATFYAHFPDKYALLEYSIRQAFMQALEKRTLSACHYSPDNLKALVVIVCEFLAQANNLCKAGENHFESLVENQVRKQIQELLEFWLEQVRSELDPKTAATAASWVIYGLAQEWSRNKHRSPAEVYAQDILPLVQSNLQLKEDG